MHEHIILIRMELSPFANIIDIFIIKIRFKKKKLDSKGDFVPMRPQNGLS